MDLIPEPPLIAASLGGPAIIYIATPLRNAITIGTLDAQKGVIGIYRDLFSGGARQTFAGGQYLAAANVPGFLVLGPLFHVYKKVAGGSNEVAVLLTSISQSAILYGSETKSAQVAYNRSAANRGLVQIDTIQNAFVPWGPGIFFHISRNMMVMSGFRIFSSPCQDVLARTFPDASPALHGAVGDIIANCASSACSTPFHQLYQFMLIKRQANKSLRAEPVVSMCKQVLSQQYLTPCGKVSSVAARDVVLRVLYCATIMSMYASVEQAAVALWPKVVK